MALSARSNRNILPRLKRGNPEPFPIEHRPVNLTRGVWPKSPGGRPALDPFHSNRGSSKIVRSISGYIEGCSGFPHVLIAGLAERKESAAEWALNQSLTPDGVRVYPQWRLADKTSVRCINGWCHPSVYHLEEARFPSFLIWLLPS
jgi:hypothetical protein